MRINVKCGLKLGLNLDLRSASILIFQHEIFDVVLCKNILPFFYIYPLVGARSVLHILYRKVSIFSIISKYNAKHKMNMYIQSGYILQYSHNMGNVLLRGKINLYRTFFLILVLMIFRFQLIH